MLKFIMNTISVCPVRLLKAMNVIFATSYTNLYDYHCRALS